MSTANPMREQILATPGALKAAFAQMEREARLVLPTPEIYRVRRIVLTGSGDSYFAAKSAETAFLAHAGLPVEVRTPLEAGRYHASLSARRDLENTLVIAISNSGAAARVAEAAGLYRAAGAATLALTRNAEGRLARTTARTLVLPVPSFPASPGFGPYLFALVGLLLLAIRVGEVRLAMTMDEAQAQRRQLEASFDMLAATIAATDGPAREAAARLAERKLLEFTGGGPALAASGYGAAKMLEASGRHAFAQDLEEWTHLNYFDAIPGEIATIVALSRGSRSESRAAELLVYMRKLGRHVVIVGGGPLADAAAAAGEPALPVDADLPEIWSPLLLSAPHALLAAHLAELTGAEYGRGGKGAWDDSAAAATVQQGEIWEAGR